jgi:hypothetical protein
MPEVFPAPLQASFFVRWARRLSVAYIILTRLGVVRSDSWYTLSSALYHYSVPTRHIKPPIAVVLVNSESDTFTEPLAAHLRQQTKSMPAICERLIKIGESIAEHT